MVQVFRLGKCTGLYLVFICWFVIVVEIRSRGFTSEIIFVLQISVFYLDDVRLDLMRKLNVFSCLISLTRAILKWWYLFPKKKVL